MSDGLATQPGMIHVPSEAGVPDFGNNSRYINGNAVSISPIINGLTHMTMCYWGKRSNSGHRLGMGTNPIGNGTHDAQLVFTAPSPRIVATARKTVTSHYIISSHSGTGWHHVALTYSPGSMSLYQNGLHVNTSAATPTNLSTVPTQCYWGGHLLESNQTVYATSQGHVCDFRFYNRALSAAEILSIKNFNHITDGLIGWFATDVDSIDDQSGNDLVGTERVSPTLFVSGDGPKP